MPSAKPLKSRKSQTFNQHLKIHTKIFRTFHCCREAVFIVRQDNRFVNSEGERFEDFSMTKDVTSKGKYLHNVYAPHISCRCRYLTIVESSRLIFPSNLNFSHTLTCIKFHVS